MSADFFTLMHTSIAYFSAFVELCLRLELTESHQDHFLFVWPSSLGRVLIYVDAMNVTCDESQVSSSTLFDGGFGTFVLLSWVRDLSENLREFAHLTKSTQLTFLLALLFLRCYCCYASLT